MGWSQVMDYPLSGGRITGVGHISRPARLAGFLSNLGRNGAAVVPGRRLMSFSRMVPNGTSGVRATEKWSKP